jgi:hypothetical protein
MTRIMRTAEQEAVDKTLADLKLRSAYESRLNLKMTKQGMPTRTQTLLLTERLGAELAPILNQSKPDFQKAAEVVVGQVQRSPWNQYTAEERKTMGFVLAQTAEAYTDLKEGVTDHMRLGEPLAAQRGYQIPIFTHSAVAALLGLRYSTDMFYLMAEHDVDEDTNRIADDILQMAYKRYPRTMTKNRWHLLAPAANHMERRAFFYGLSIHEMLSGALENLTNGDHSYALASIGKSGIDRVLNNYTLWRLDPKGAFDAAQHFDDRKRLKEIGKSSWVLDLLMKGILTRLNEQSRHPYQGRLQQATTELAWSIFTSVDEYSDHVRSTSLSDPKYKGAVEDIETTILRSTTDGDFRIIDPPLSERIDVSDKASLHGIYTNMLSVFPTTEKVRRNLQKEYGRTPTEAEVDVSLSKMLDVDASSRFLFAGVSDKGTVRERYGLLMKKQKRWETLMTDDPLLRYQALRAMRQATLLHLIDGSYHLIGNEHARRQEPGSEGTYMRKTG